MRLAVSRRRAYTNISDAIVVSVNIVTVGEESLRKDTGILVSALARDGFTGLPMAESGAGIALCRVTIY